MVLVIAIGVTCSTLVNGPVAMMFTLSFITLGFFRQFFVDVATGKQVGGGPLESLYRIVTQMNQMSPLPENFGTRLINAIDTVLKHGMQSLAYVLPDFRSFSTVDYVAYGFNIPMNQLAQDLTVVPGLRGRAVRHRILLPADARGGQMTERTSFYRKIAYRHRDRRAGCFRSSG